MVRALLAGRKTQTRRVAKIDLRVDGALAAASQLGPKRYAEVEAFNAAGGKCPYGVPGDRLWVRENGWERPERSARDMREGADTWKPYYFDASIAWSDHEQFKEWGFKRRPSIHMPRWACRLMLEVTAVRVERLQDISEEDAKAEGVEKNCDGLAAHPDCPACKAAGKCQAEGEYLNYLHDGDDFPADSAKASYASLWDSLNAKSGHGWVTNPWVWVIEFKRGET